jgi:hypothetical protein
MNNKHDPGVGTLARPGVCDRLRWKGTSRRLLDEVIGDVSSRVGDLPLIADPKGDHGTRFALVANAREKVVGRLVRVADLEIADVVYGNNHPANQDWAALPIAPQELLLQVRLAQIELDLIV